MSTEMSPVFTFPIHETPENHALPTLTPYYRQREGEERGKERRKEGGREEGERDGRREVRREKREERGKRTGEGAEMQVEEEQMNMALF